MALPLPAGLTPSEVAFLCEMEQVTVIPRQRLEGLELLGVGEMLLEAASDDIAEPDTIRRLMRDLREVRMAKMRAGGAVLEGGVQVKMNGVGGMEVAEGRAFIVGVVDGLRKIGASKEQSRREKEAEERENGMGGIGDDEDEMGL
ncbi:MAG: hypothetical protein Q9167_007450 [Letrouitia subvulpina]